MVLRMGLMVVALGWLAREKLEVEEVALCTLPQPHQHSMQLSLGRIARLACRLHRECLWLEEGLDLCTRPCSSCWCSGQVDHPSLLFELGALEVLIQTFKSVASSERDL